MVAFASFVALLVAAPPLFAAPIAHKPHEARYNIFLHRRACNTKVAPKPPSSDLATTTTHRATTTSSVEANPTEKPFDGSFAQVWPMSVSNAKAVWSTAAEVPGHVRLNDAALNIRSGASTSHVYTDAPDGSYALRAFYEKGSISPGHTPGDLTHGFSLYSKTGIDLSEGTEVLFSYKAYFQDGFNFNLGGKMPGLYGGEDDAIAMTCSGGNHGENKCWSARMMFRPGGAGELYAYFPQLDSNANALAKVTKTFANDVYGTSVGRGTFTWKRGTWTSISQRIKLNDVGQKNGEFQVWADGVSIMNISGLVFRMSENSRVRGAQIETFFGGHDPSWASPKDQCSWFKDFSAAVLA